MNSRRYWKNRLPFLLTNLVCMAALTVFLLVCGNSVSAVVLILIVWALILLTGLVLTYWKRKRQMKKLLDMAEQLSERYLISEVMELPEQAEDQVYYQLLKMAGKSMLEQIGEVERERLEYKEYIEQWIHEIKTPAQITDTHSTCIGISVYLAEGLYLHCTGERCHGICQHIVFGWQETYCK